MSRLVSAVFVATLLIFPALTPAAAAEPEVRAFWVELGDPGLRSPGEVDILIENVKLGNFNTIIAQVRRNAQSLYAKQHPNEGWIENYVPPPGFDPLQYLLDKAKPEGIEVHAWVNIGAWFTSNPTVPTAAFPCRTPCDPNHTFNLHGWFAPESENWMTRTHPNFTLGATFSGYRMAAPSNTWFMDLGHPDAAQHTIDVLTNLLRNYDVDGIHLDYIRYPETPIVPLAQRPPGAPTLAFAIGYNPTSVHRFNAAFGRPAGSLPNYWDASWNQWRRDQVSAFVRRLYLEMGFIDPSASLSAALITFFRGPNTTEPRTFQQTEAYYRVFQDWGGWMKEGILDMSIPMVYKNHPTESHRIQFEEWIEFTKDTQHNRFGVIGLGSFMNPLLGTLQQIAAGRTPSAAGNRTRGFNFFSYHDTSGTITGADIPGVTREHFFDAVTQDGAVAAEAPFRAPASIPVMSWKTDPRVGHLLAQILHEDGSPADGARVKIAKVGGGPRDEAIVQHADGNGYVGGVDLNPGAYQLVIEIPGAADRVTIPEPVTPGRVTRVRVHLGHASRGPMIRAEREIGEHERLDRFGEEASPAEDWLREPLPDDAVSQQP